MHFSDADRKQIDRVTDNISDLCRREQLTRKNTVIWDTRNMRRNLAPENGLWFPAASASVCRVFGACRYCCYLASKQHGNILTYLYYSDQCSVAFWRGLSRRILHCVSSSLLPLQRGLCDQIGLFVCMCDREKVSERKWEWERGRGEKHTHRHTHTHTHTHTQREREGSREGVRGGQSRENSKRCWQTDFCFIFRLNFPDGLS